MAVGRPRPAGRRVLSGDCTYVGQGRSDKKSKAACRALLRVRRIFEGWVHIASGIRPLLASAVAVAGLFGLGGSFFASWLKPYLAGVGFLFLGFAAFIAWSSDFAEKAASAFSSLQKLKEKNLQERKAEVAELLRQLKSPILVVIDDLDRLTADEVKLVFQLIKANADFPNLVYLTLFQRDIVEMSLEKVTSGLRERLSGENSASGIRCPAGGAEQTSTGSLRRTQRASSGPKI